MGVVGDSNGWVVIEGFGLVVSGGVAMLGGSWDGSMYLVVTQSRWRC